MVGRVPALRAGTGGDGWSGGASSGSACRRGPLRGRLATGEGRFGAVVRQPAGQGRTLTLHHHRCLCTDWESLLPPSTANPSECIPS